MASLADTLRWGLLGTAHINRRLIPAMRAARRSSVAAVASRDGARAASYAAEWNIPVAHAGYDVLLRDPSIDAIYVPLYFYKDLYLTAILYAVFFVMAAMGWRAWRQTWRTNAAAAADVGPLVGAAAP